MQEEWILVCNYLRFHTRNYVDGAGSWALHSQGKNPDPVWTRQQVSPTTHLLLKLCVSNMPLVGLLITYGRDQNVLHDDYVHLWW